MEILELDDISLKVIDLTKSHAAFAQQSKDNFTEIENYINNLRLRVSSLDGTESDITASVIKTYIRSQMINTVNLTVTHVDGTTLTEDNGFSVTRSGNSFIIQTPDSVSELIHNLRVKSSRRYASSYDITMDTSNQITINFSTFIKEDLELLIFG